MGIETSSSSTRLINALRLRWTVAALAVCGLAVAVAAVVVFVVQPGYGENIKGPFGDYPARLRLIGPPGRVVDEVSGPVRLFDGLALVGPGSRVLAPSGSGRLTIRDGVAAVNVATGRPYWMYSRPGHDVLDALALSDGLYVLWDDGLLAKLDARGARIAWHAELGTGAVAGRARLWSEIRRPSTILVIGQRQLTSVGIRDGSVGWSHRAPAGCEFNVGWPAETVRVIAVEDAPAGTGCTHPALRAYELSSGRLLWKLSAATVGVPVAAGRGEIVENLGGGIFDERTGRRVGTLQAGGQIQPSSADGGLVAGAALHPPARTFGCWDARTGRLLWSRHPAPGQSLTPAPTIVDGGHILVITSSSGPRALRFWLSVYDARTGTPEVHLRIPVLLPANLRADSRSADYYIDTLDPTLIAAAPGLAGILEPGLSTSGVLGDAVTARAILVVT